MNWNDWILGHEISVRLGFFIGVLAAIGGWELVAPRRTLTVSKLIRWSNNLGLVFLNTLILRLLFPAAATGIAVLAQQRGWGLFNSFAAPLPLATLISIVMLDGIIYLQHVMLHAVPVLWRLHRVHHADPEYDVTTGTRFHPLEIVLSMLIKFAAIILLGAPVVSVVVFEVILNATAMFNHGNIKLPGNIDRALRLLVVTPDMHRVHHSVENDETNSNFGFSLSWWDRLFGTYRDQPRAGHTDMTIGIRKYREPRQITWLPGMLMLPFKGRVSGYSSNRRNWNRDDGN